MKYDKKNIMRNTWAIKSVEMARLFLLSSVFENVLK